MRRLTRRALPMLLAFLTVCSSFALPSSAEPIVYRSVATASHRIALTFDDGPHPTQTAQILEILARYGVKATFFMVGQNVRLYPETARAVLAAGHEIGNHTASHPHLDRLNEVLLDAELEACESALEELCEYRSHLFRPPEGALTPFVGRLAEGRDYTLVLWSVDPRDWEKPDAARIADEVLTHVRPGAIILLHDYVGRKSATPEALEMLLPALLAEGYEPVTVSRLLGFG